ncbi:MAG: TrmJ/YjtD family RNA methyltransferase [Candidatus Lokiarchaeota archaeon]|nr:TrmJ/YjtD family RNA methyltransferase [Candidatus Lokiarchaeota archaeon]
MTELANISIILVEPETPGNVGFASRVLANFGVSDLRIVGDDPRQEQDAQIFSVHALELLESASIFEYIEDALEGIDNVWASTARIGRNHSVTRAAVPLPHLPNPTTLDGRVGILFGRESIGLMNEEIDLSDIVFTIPVSPEYPSLNLSHAIAVVLYELFHKYAPEAEPRKNDPKPATMKEKNQVSIFFDEVVDIIPIRDYKKPIAKQVFRNLLGRAFMTGREVATLTGTIRRMRNYILDPDKYKNE